MPTHFSVSDLLHTTDRDLGSSEWRTITQEQINQFADATGDHQWIHVDPKRAAKGPFGQTVAHGYLTLSLLPQMIDDLMVIDDMGMGVNYGIDKLRLTGPVPSGSRIRARARILDGESKGDGVLYRINVTVDIEDHERPALVGTVLYLVYAS